MEYKNATTSFAKINASTALPPLSSFSYSGIDLPVRKRKRSESSDIGKIWIKTDNNGKTYLSVLIDEGFQRRYQGYDQEEPYSGKASPKTTP